jgi:hypothetical protein
MRTAIDEDDLVRGFWRVAKIEQKKGKGNEGKETAGSHTNISNEEEYELVEEEGKREEKGNKDKRSHIKGDSEHTTDDETAKWIDSLSLDARKALAEKLMGPLPKV